MRALLIAVVLVVGVGGTAEARRGGGVVVINTGDDVFPIRDLTPEQAAAVGFSKLGYRYELFGVFWFHLWRWDGEFVVYDGNVYASIDDEQLAALGGASVPWRYHLPDGLLLVLAGIELLIITRTKRRLKTTLVIGGALVAIAVAFYFMGLDWEFLIPLFLGGHHLVGSYFAIKKEREHEADVAVAAEVVRASTADARRSISQAGDDASHDSGRHTHPTPRGGVDMVDAAIASRPSQPIIVDRPSTAPAVVPMRSDDSVDGPKLLR